MRTYLKAALTLVIIGLMAIFPFISSNFALTLLTEILIFSIFALSLNILVGYTGLISLGHAAFFGLGAYTVGIIAKNISANLFLTLLIALLISFLFAFIIGLICTRVSGFYFLMITLAFSQMIYAIVHQWFGLTGGTNGLSGIPKPSLFGDVVLQSSTAIYYLVALMFLLVYFGLKPFVQSPFGKTLIGIKENEARMQAAGYHTYLYKTLSFVIAGTLGGLAGCLYAYFNGFVSPGDVYWTMSAQGLIMVLIGGAGTLIGPVLGAAFIVILETVVSGYTKLWMMIVGIVFIIFVIFIPQGIVGLKSLILRLLPNLSSRTQAANEEKEYRQEAKGLEAEQPQLNQINPKKFNQS